MFTIIGYGIVTIAILIIVWDSFFIVQQQRAFVLERLGKFNSVRRPGLNFKWPIIDSVVEKTSLRIQQIDVPVETKTLDDVTVKVNITVQYKISNDKVEDAFYKLEDLQPQMTSYILDVVRAKIPDINLDDVFSKKDEVGNEVKGLLTTKLHDLGPYIIDALVTDIDPDPLVKESMNSINAARRNRMAVEEKAKAERILIVKNAEADKESKILQGEGVAGQRKAILDGFKESLDQFVDQVPGVEAKDILGLIVQTNHLDVIKEIGLQSNTIMMPHSPQSSVDQMREAFITADITANVPKAGVDS